MSIGYKLAAGLQLLLEWHSTGEHSGPERQWTHYLQTLSDQGYFMGELDGSKLYKKRLDIARKNFDELFAERRDKTSDFKDLLSRFDSNSLNLPDPGDGIPPDDDDSWLELTEEDVNRLLLNQWTSAASSNATEEEHCATGVNDVVEGMKNFVDNMSSYEGVETANPIPSSDCNDIAFDVDGFADAMDRLLADSSTDDETSESDDEDRDILDADYSHPDSTCRTNLEMEDSRMASVVQSMDEELAACQLRPLVRDNHNQRNEEATADSADEDDSDLKINSNLVKNFLDSFAAQEGLSGPVSNILNSMGMSLPPEAAR